MKIAVPYENGMVFPHFGKTETFKVYHAENGTVVSSELLETAGSGHEALAELLAGQGVDLVICGGLGAGAQQALALARVEVCSGAQGDADAAVADWLAGKLVNAGASCTRHEEAPSSGCGGHCGSCGGCHSAPMFDGPNVGKTVSVHYRGTLDDGTEFDSSYSRNEPLKFICGVGMMISGFDAAVAGMEIGDTAQIHLTPAEAYGAYDPSNIFTFPIAEVPGCEGLHVGDQVALYDQMGRSVPVTVSSMDDENIVFDANHELAGKELNFTIELLDSED